MRNFLDILSCRAVYCTTTINSIKKNWAITNSGSLLGSEIAVVIKDYRIEALQFLTSQLIVDLWILNWNANDANDSPAPRYLTKVNNKMSIFFLVYAVRKKVGKMRDYFHRRQTRTTTLKSATITKQDELMIFLLDTSSDRVLLFIFVVFLYESVYFFNFWTLWPALAACQPARLPACQTASQQHVDLSGKAVISIDGEGEGE